jgi:hypothetical protein
MEATAEGRNPFREARINCPRQKLSGERSERIKLRKLTLKEINAEGRIDLPKRL